MNEKFLREITSYMDKTNKVIKKQKAALEKYSMEKQAYTKAVSKIVEQGVRNKVIPHMFSDTVKRKFEDDPVKFAEYVISETSKVTTIGAPSGYSTRRDPIAELCYPE
jgi:hypothetical protein